MFMFLDNKVFGGKRKRDGGGGILSKVEERRRVSGYRYRGPGFDPRRYHIF